MMMQGTSIRRRNLFTYSLLMLWVISATPYANPVDELARQFEAGETDTALAQLEQILSQTPDDYSANFLKARIIAKKGDFASSNEIYRKLIQQSPGRPESYNNLAMQLARQGDLKQAQQILEQAMKTHPGYAAVYENLSAVYVEMARDSYGKALRLDAPAKTVSLKEVKTIEQVQLATAGSNDKTGHGSTGIAAPAADTSTTAIAVPASTTPVRVESPAPGINKEEIISTLQGWAAAWSEQAVEMYLVFYADSYNPPGLSRQNWEIQRKQRIKKPSWIQVALKDFDIQPINNKEARVRLIQEYRASNYQDRTRKEFQLRSTPDGWRIIAERDLSN